MSVINNICLHIRKRLNPNLLEFGQLLSDKNIGDTLNLKVIHSDQRNELVSLTITGKSLHYPTIASAVNSLGGCSIESIETIDFVNEEY